jgi:uncharacterized membrane protein YeaQ/YmgE (transglycosylase-associated protein family)
MGIIDLNLSLQLIGIWILVDYIVARSVKVNLPEGCPDNLITTLIGTVGAVVGGIVFGVLGGAKATGSRSVPMSRR